MNKLTKFCLLLGSGYLVTACETAQKPTPPDIGSTYNMPNQTSGQGTFVVLEGGKRKVLFEPTDLDIISEDACTCCSAEGFPKEGAILRTNRSVEFRVGNLTPSVTMEDIELGCCSDNPAILEVVFKMKVAHSAGDNANLPIIEVPVFLTATNLPTQEVYLHRDAMLKVNLNQNLEIQKFRVRFDASDLKARGLKGWSFVTGIMKSEMNRTFEAQVGREAEHNIAEAAGRQINTTRTGVIPPTVRASEAAAPDLIVK